MTAADVAGHNPFLIAADLIEYGRVRPETREQTRAAVTAQLRATVPADVRADIRRAVEQEGWELPDWLKP